MKNNHKFSIIIPAYNEEKLISDTLDHLKTLNYPRDKYEILVIVNGSTDNTFEKANQYANETSKIFNIKEKGASLARNFGIKKSSPDTDCLIIIDSDSYIQTDFLNELNDFLNKNEDKKFAYGTAFSTPSDDDSLAAKIWESHINHSMIPLKMFHCIHVVKKEFSEIEVYDENLVSAEDIKYARDLSKHGRFFSLRTKNFFTSTRRIKKIGYLKMFLLNVFSGIMPHKTWKEFR